MIITGSANLNIHKNVQTVYNTTLIKYTTYKLSNNNIGIQSVCKYNIQVEIRFILRSGKIRFRFYLKRGSHKTIPANYYGNTYFDFFYFSDKNIFRINIITYLFLKLAFSYYCTMSIQKKKSIRDKYCKNSYQIHNKIYVILIIINYAFMYM